MNDRIMIPADLAELALREILEETRQLSARLGTACGVDQVGKCIQAVRALAEEAQQAHLEQEGYGRGEDK